MDSTAFPDLQDTGNSMDVKTPAGGSTTLELYNPPDVDISPIRISDTLVGRQDLSNIRAVSDRPVIGILGAVSLRDFVVQVDFDENSLRLFRPDSLPHPEWGTQIPIESHALTPAIHLDAFDQHLLFNIDTGSDRGVEVTSALFDSVQRSFNGAVDSSPNSVLGRTVMLRTMRISTFEVAKMRYRDVLIDETKGEFGCSLGLKFLSRHMVTIDFHNLRLYLKPGKQYSRRDEEGMSGMHILRPKSQTVAQVVDKDSPAYEAGIREGDILLAVNQKPAGEYDIEDLRDLLQSQDGKEIFVTYLRGDTTKMTKFKLRRRI
ncbi:MAG: PDZ domain-containing protein [Tepidisphaeraceae bacterium]